MDAVRILNSFTPTLRNELPTSEAPAPQSIQAVTLGLFHVRACKIVGMKLATVIKAAIALIVSCYAGYHPNRLAA